MLFIKQTKPEQEQKLESKTLSIIVITALFILKCYHGVHIWNIMERNIPPSILYNSFKYLSKKLFKKMTYIIDCAHDLKCYNML